MKASQAACSPYCLLSIGDYLGKQLGEWGGGKKVGRDLKIYYSSEAATTYILFTVLLRFLTVIQVLIWHSLHSWNSHESHWVFRALIIQGQTTNIRLQLQTTFQVQVIGYRIFEFPETGKEWAEMMKRTGVNMWRGSWYSVFSIPADNLSNELLVLILPQEINKSCHSAKRKKSCLS